MKPIVKVKINNPQDLIGIVTHNIDEVNKLYNGYNIKFYDNDLSEDRALDLFQYIIRKCTNIANKWNLENLDPIINSSNIILEGYIIQVLGKDEEEAKKILEFYLENTNSFNQCPEVLQMLLNKGLEPNLVVNNIFKEELPLIFHLIENSFYEDLNNVVVGNIQALNVLLQYPHKKILENYVLNAAINIDDQIIECTPLHWATYCARQYQEKGNLEAMQIVVQKLLDAGANPNLKSTYNGKQVTFLELAAELNIPWKKEVFVFLNKPLNETTVEFIDELLEFADLEEAKKNTSRSMIVGAAAIIPVISLQAIFTYFDVINEINRLSNSTVLGSIVNIASIVVLSGIFAFITSLVFDTASKTDLPTNDLNTKQARWSAQKALINAGLIVVANALITTAVEISLAFIAKEYEMAIKIVGIGSMLIADIILARFATSAIEKAL